MTVLVQLMQPGAWNVWSEDERHVVQAIVHSATEPKPRIIQELVDGQVVSVLVAEDGTELARSGMDPD